jgi:hypothetical protein
MTDTYKIGDFIVITNDFIEKQYEIIGAEDGFIRLLDCILLVQSSCKCREISELILRGTASVIPKSKYDRELTHPLALDFSGYPDEKPKEDLYMLNQY